MAKLNIELFKKIRDRIAAIPESYEQGLFVTDSPRSPCGAAACLAGEAIICNAPSVEEGVAELRRLNSSHNDPWAVADRATSLLGMSGSFGMYAEEDDTEAAGETLIFDEAAEYWPETYRKMFQDGDTDGAAVAFLDEIIQTGEIKLNIPDDDEIKPDTKEG